MTEETREAWNCWKSAEKESAQWQSMARELAEALRGTFVGSGGMDEAIEALQKFDALSKK